MRMNCSANALIHIQRHLAVANLGRGKVGDIVSDRKGAESRRPARVDNTLSELGPVESLLLLQENRIGLGRESSDVEGVLGGGQNCGA